MSARVLLRGLFALAAVLVVTGVATAQQPSISGKWSGWWVNSVAIGDGGSGPDSLIITQHDEGTITGTWLGLKVEKGERVTAEIAQWACKNNAGGNYNARCYIKEGGKLLVVEYTVTYRENGKVQGYTGVSILKRQ